MWRIQQKLDAIIKTPKESTEIDIWIDSPGGDAHAAYKLMLDLRSRAHTIRAVVPDWAKSAATLMLLGVDQIYMAAGAELGPLDVQITHPDRETEVISALDVASSLTYLSTFAFQAAILGGASIIEYTGLARSEVLDSSLKFVAEFLRPCVAKIDPHRTRRAVYQLKVAEKYADALLASRTITKEKKLSGAKIAGLVQRLVNDYPVHEFVISRNEATDLGLPVENIELYPALEGLKSVHDDFVKSGQSIVTALQEPEGSPDSASKKGKRARRTKKPAVVTGPSGNQEQDNEGKIEKPSRASARANRRAIREVSRRA